MRGKGGIRVVGSCLQAFATRLAELRGAATTCCGRNLPHSCRRGSRGAFDGRQSLHISWLRACMMTECVFYRYFTLEDQERTSGQAVGSISIFSRPCELVGVSIALAKRHEASCLSVRAFRHHSGKVAFFCPHRSRQSRRFTVCAAFRVLQYKRC